MIDLRADFRRLMLGAMAGIVPIIKSLLLYKIIASESLTLILWFISFQTFFVPLLTLGWSEYAARCFALYYKSWLDKTQLLNSVVFIHVGIFSFIATGISALFFCFNLKLMCLIYFWIILSTIYFHWLKLVRSKSIEIFFSITMLKTFLDLLVLLASFNFIGPIQAERYLFLDMTTFFLFVIAMKLYLGHVQRRIQSRQVFAFWIRYRRQALAVFYSILSLSISTQLDRIILVKLLTTSEYSVYVFVSIIKNLFLSAAALFYTVLYGAISNLLKSSIEKGYKVVGNYIRNYFLLLAPCSLIPAFTFCMFSKYFFSEIDFNFIDIFISSFIGTLYLFPIFEIYYLLRLKTELISKITFLSGLIQFLLLLLIKFVNFAHPITYSLIVLLFARLIQLLSWYFYFQQEVIQRVEGDSYARVEIN